MLQVLTATDAVDASTQHLDLNSNEAVDALIAGEIDVAIFATQLDTSFLQRATRRSRGSINECCAS